MQEKERELKRLQEKVREANEAYYAKNESPLSDYEYDMLAKKLEALEAELGVKPEEAVSQEVGSSLANTKFQKTPHKTPMLSLANSYNTGDIEDFLVRAEKGLGVSELELALEIKLDGLSISVLYEKGRLVKAITRGDGVIGEDVTENVMQIANIPHQLKEPVSVEVRGEIVLPIPEFKALNEKRLERGEDVFANPRNAASGTLRQLDAKVVKERNLAAYFYFLVDAPSYDLKSQLDSVNYLAELGLPTTGICEICKSVEALEARIAYWSEERETLDYESDGLVMKINRLDYWELLGSTGKAPRWAIAYKFPAKQARTRLLDISWQLGRTGKMTPVAELAEVEVSGSKVRRASLHNYEEICRKDIKIGDYVFIEKAAEIIPQVVKAIKEERDGTEKDIVPPEHCPVCQSTLEQEEGLVDLKCLNPHCPGKQQGELEYFVSRNGMNISGLGKRILEKLFELGYLESAADIYRLKEHREDLMQLDKMGEKSVENLLASIEASKNMPYEKVLYALGIPFVGKVAAKQLAKASKSMKVLSKMSLEELEALDGVGTKMAAAIHSFFQQEEKQELLADLEKAGLQFAEEEQEGEAEGGSKPFEGKSFLVTGTLAHYKRADLQEELEGLGATILSSVTKKLDYLIVGEKAGSKLTKAKALGTVEILTEAEFLALKEKLTK